MSKKVIIIGGGVSGISAAYYALKNGFEVSLIESSSSLGGRINSREDKETGDIIDNGQHLLVGAYNVFLEILNEVGTSETLEIQNKFNVKYIDNIGTFELKETLFQGQIGLLFGLLNLDRISFIEKVNTIKFIIKMKLGIFDNINVPLEKLLSKHKQSNQIINIFWEPLCIAMLNTPIHLASSKIFTNVLKQSFFAPGINSKIIIPKVSLSELVKPIEEYLINNGVNILFNTTAKSFEIENNRITSLKLSKDKEITADFYISCLPFHKIDKLINTKIDLINASIISAYLWYDKKFFNDDFVAVLNKNIQWIFNKRAYGFTGSSNSYPEFLSIVISDADKLINTPNSEILEIIKSEINDLYPVEKSLLHHKIIKEKNATYLSDINSIHTREKFHSPYKNLLIAGDWTDTTLPSTIETAARSGKNAINQIVK